MNRTFGKLLFSQMLICLASLTYAQPASRISWNEGWTFTKDGQSKVVTLPHDWGVEGPFVQKYDGETGKLAWWGKAEYSKNLVVDADDLGNHKFFFLDIDGAMSYAKVYCNGKFVTEWPYGYASFQADLTPFLKPGSNEVKVTLDNPQKSSRWYPGGGIYRNVWIEKRDPVSIDNWGVTIKTTDINLVEQSATVDVYTVIRNRLGDEPFDATVITDIFFGKRRYMESEAVLSRVTDGYVAIQHLNMKEMVFWSPDRCNVLTARTIVNCNDWKDTVYTNFAVRVPEFKADGFYLNGLRTPLKGVCLHHDAGALGAVWNKSVWVRRLNMLKNMGCNAIRTSHNPPAPEFLDLCDSLGFLVMDELTDTWTVSKTENGYAQLFDEWADKDLRAMIRRDRNHPSVILWSIGNEVSEQDMPEKYSLAFHLAEICHQEDPTRMVTSGCDRPKTYLTDFRKALDVFGFNYKPQLYGKFHEAFPDQPYLGSETASCISSRGVYMFPPSDKKEYSENNFQVCSYDLYTVPWGHTPEEEWKWEDENPSCAGEFVWTGFDYLGEPTPFRSADAPSRSSYFGIIDLAGFPKDRYWIYKARWNDEPMLHILPHWNWEGREGQVTPVHVYTNLDEVELFVNGKSQGRLTRGKNQYRLRWDNVVYKPGKIVAKGYKDGKTYIEKITTAGPAAMLDVSYEYGAEKDLIFVTVRVTDKKGNFVPTAQNLLKFSVAGAGKLIAVDAGDPTSQVPFHSDEIPAFNGLCSAIIRPAEGSGPITLTVTSPGLKTANAVIEQ